MGVGYNYLLVSDLWGHKSMLGVDNSNYSNQRGIIHSKLVGFVS